MGSSSIPFPFLGKAEVVVPPQGPGKAQGASLPSPQPCLASHPHPRFAHGGSLATMMDETFSKTAYLAGEGLFTLSLSIRFKK